MLAVMKMLAAKVTAEHGAARILDQSRPLS